MKYHLINFSTLLFLSITADAQTIDTVYLQGSEYIYYVVEKDSSGRKIGPVAYYDKEDRLKKSVNYNETTWYTYFENRFSSYAIHKRDGKNRIINPGKFYDENDNLVVTQTYKNGKLVLITHYDTLGNKIQVIPYKNGKLHGTSYTYHPNGQVEWTKGYRKGKLHGERILRDSLGNLVSGEDRHHFPNSDSFIETNCTDGRPHGKFEVVSLKNGVSYSGHYDHGFPDGEYNYYDNEGNITRIDLYKKGKFKKTIDF